MNIIRYSTTHARRQHYRREHRQEWELLKAEIRREQRKEMAKRDLEKMAQKLNVDYAALAKQGGSKSTFDVDESDEDRLETATPSPMTFTDMTPQPSSTTIPIDLDGVYDSFEEFAHLNEENEPSTPLFASVFSHVSNSPLVCTCPSSLAHNSDHQDHKGSTNNSFHATCNSSTTASFLQNNNTHTNLMSASQLPSIDDYISSSSSRNLSDLSSTVMDRKLWKDTSLYSPLATTSIGGSSPTFMSSQPQSDSQQMQQQLAVRTASLSAEQTANVLAYIDILTIASQPLQEPATSFASNSFDVLPSMRTVFSPEPTSLIQQQQQQPSSASSHSSILLSNFNLRSLDRSKSVSVPLVRQNVNSNIPNRLPYTTSLLSNNIDDSILSFSTFNSSLQSNSRQSNLQHVNVITSSSTAAVDLIDQLCYPVCRYMMQLCCL